MEYSQWYKELDSICIEILNSKYEDMPDLTLIRYLYDEGLSPKDAFEICCDAWADEDSNFADFIGYC